MISQVPQSFSESRTSSDSAEAGASASGSEIPAAPVSVVLARYGNVPQVARFVSPESSLTRGMLVVAETDRGQEIATVLDTIAVRGDEAHTGTIVRRATDQDLLQAKSLTVSANQQFADWARRVSEWKLELELIDLERTLDDRLILYVLNDRGAETTRLALLTAANGLGIVHVQPVSAEGIISASGGGCGSSCGCSTH